MQRENLVDPFLETNRLTIREFTKEDLDSLHSILSDKEVMKFSISGPLSKIQIKELLDDIIKNYKTDLSLWALEVKETKELIGFSGFKKEYFNNKEYIELLYRLKKDMWNKGYASEAANAIMEHAFKDLNLNELITLVSPVNRASVKVVKKLNMTIYKKGNFQGFLVHIYKLDKKDFDKDLIKQLISKKKK